MSVCCVSCVWRTACWEKNSSRCHFEYFTTKKRWTFHAKYFYSRWFVLNTKPYFSGKYNRNIWAAQCENFFGHMRIAKAQISLRIRTVWSGLSLSANRIIGYQKSKSPVDTLRRHRIVWSLILRIFEGTSSLDAPHIINIPSAVFLLFFSL